MSATAHPSTAVLADYASGALPQAPGLVVAAHLEQCRHCRHRIMKLEALAGAFLSALDPAPLGAGALDAALTHLAAPLPAARKPPRASAIPGVPAAVRQTGLGARRWFGVGRWIAPIRAPRTDGWRAILLRAPAGAQMPIHTHSGPEFTCVLTGAFRDSGQIYRAGDFVEITRDRRHRIEVTDQGPCLSILACRGPLRGSLTMAAVGRILGL